MLGTKDLYKRVAGTGLVGLLLLVAPGLRPGRVPASSDR